MERDEFNIIKNTLHTISLAKRSYQSGIPSDGLPHIFGFKLTNRCNLRCKHCYEWNDQGYHNHLEKADQNCDLDLNIILKCMQETDTVHPSFYLWGGEPLIYYKIGELLEILARRKAIVAICTNGHAILKHVEVLQKFGHNLELLIALDGNEKNNDALRGKGSYQKTMQAIDTLVALKKQGLFQGKISVHTMISNDNVDSTVDYVSQMQEKGVENLILCFPWFISEAVSSGMDDFFDQHFSWLDGAGHGDKRSWHAFKYRIENEKYNKVIEEVRKIKNRTWEMNVKIQPNIESDAVHGFLDGEDILRDTDSRCLSVYSRMDILPNGKVTSCKHFPEFTVGDLRKQSVAEIWNSDEMNRIRQTLKDENAPVCSKCNNLYLHGYKK